MSQIEDEEIISVDFGRRHTRLAAHSRLLYDRLIELGILTPLNTRDLYPLLKADN